MYDESLYNINLKDFSLEETDNINLFEYIRFINEIIFNKFFNTKNYNNSNIVMKQSKRIINYDGITGRVKADNKFLNISKEELKNYLNYICGKDINDNIIIEKDNEKKIIA